MQENIRYRTIGAIFLVSVGVIVLPMLLDSPTRHAPPELDHGVFEQGPEENQSQNPVDGEASSGIGLPIYDEVVPASDVVEKVTQLRAKVDSKGFSTEAHRTLFGEPILTAVRSDSSVFAVQLATFVNLKNARAFLRDSHRELRRGVPVVARPDSSALASCDGRSQRLYRRRREKAPRCGRAR